MTNAGWWLAGAGAAGSIIFSSVLVWTNRPQPVNPDPYGHVPGGPDWACCKCRLLWPCPAYKQLVVAANRGRVKGVVEIMANWMGNARTELSLSAAEYHSRFVAWIYRWPEP